MTQPNQPSHRRNPSGVRTNAVAGIIFALLYVVLVNARPFSPWMPPGTLLVFAAEIRSPADCTVSAGRAVFGGMSTVSSGHAQIAKSEAPRTVLLKVRVTDGSSVLLRTSLRSGVLEIHNPRIQDEQGRVLETLPVEHAKPTPGATVESAADGALRIGMSPDAAVSFPLEKQIVMPPEHPPGRGTVLAQFFWAAAAFGGLCALLARRFPGAGARLAARFAAWAAAHTKTAIFCAALAGVLVSCHPIIFFGGSFVSPDNGTLALYDGFPTIPGDETPAAKNHAGSDIAAIMWEYIPYSQIQHEALARGEWPLRNRYAGCGLALQGQGVSMFGDPLHFIPVAANGAAWAWDLKFILARLLFAWGAGLVAFAAVRRMNVALLLALSASFLGHFAYRFSHPAHFTMCYAPWVLLPWLRASQCAGFREALKWMPLHVLASVAIFSSGALKEAVILIAALNGTGLLAMLLRPLPWRARFAPVAAMLAANGIFILIATPSWLTFLKFLANGHTVYDQPVARQIQPSLLIGLFDDWFPRQFMANKSHFDPSGNFFLLLGALWSLIRARALAREPLWLASAIVSAGALAVAYGAVPSSWIEAVPFIGNIWHVDNCFSVAAIALSFVLAAFGLRECLDRRAEASWSGDWVMFCIGLSVLCAMFFGFASAVHDSGLSSSVPDARDAVKNPFFLGYAAALFASALALPLLWRRRERTAPGIGGLCAACLAFSLLHFRHAYYGDTKFDTAVRSPQPRPDFFAKSAAMDLIRKSIASSVPSRVAGFRMNLSPDFNTLYGVETPFACDAVMNRWQWELAEAAGFTRVWNWRVLLIPEKIAPLLPALDLFGVRYYVSAPTTSETATPGLVRVARADLTVEESRTVWPRAFFTDRVARYSSPGDFMGIVRHANSVPLAAIERGAPLPPALESDAGSFARRTVVPATDYRLTPNTTSFRVNANASGVIVLGEAFEPGNYVVTVNGAPAEPFRVNHAFLGVAVQSAGSCDVVFTYRPSTWRLSLCLSVLGIALAGGGGFWAVRRVEKCGAQSGTERTA